MAKRPDKQLKQVRSALAGGGIPISAVATNLGISRSRLNRFLAGTDNLTDKEARRVLDFLNVPAPRELDERDWKNFSRNTVQSDAIGDDLVKHSLAFFTDGENASGTLVTLGNREFIATASHTIPSSKTSLRLIGRGFHAVERDDIKIIATGRMKGDNPDVGYIEIEPGTAKLLNREPIEVDRLNDAGIGQPGRTAFLFGFPYALIKTALNHRRREKIIGMRSFTYSNSLLAKEEWPSVPKDATAPKKSVDVFLPYDVTEDMIVDRKGSGPRLPNPKGAGGGGIWQGTGSITKGVWHVGKVKLIAIQSAWSQEHKYVRGVQIKHWLRLLIRDYPDLADLFEFVLRS